MVPGKVELQEKVVQVSAGDSHTAALTEDGRVFLWGSFRVRRSGRLCRGWPAKVTQDTQMIHFAVPAMPAFWWEWKVRATYVGGAQI